MATDTVAQSLTLRQRTVVQGVAFRKPIKKIANELGLSPSTVNEHLSAAKRRVGATSTDELVAFYFNKLHDPATPLSCTGPKKRVENATSPRSRSGQDDHGLLLMSDAGSFLGEPSWPLNDQPKIVPEELDGRNAILFRLVHIAKLTGLILAAFILAVLALQSAGSLIR